MLSGEFAAIFGMIGVLNGGMFLYMKGMKSDLKAMSEKIEKISNGCFERHMAIAKEEGKTEQMVTALQNRVQMAESNHGFKRDLP